MAEWARDHLDVRSARAMAHLHADLRWLTLAVLLLVAGPMQCTTPSDQGATGPHVIFISIDTARADHFDFMDSETVRNDVIQAQQLQESRDKWVLFLVAPDETVISGRGRLARTLSSEHMVFDLRMLASDPSSNQEELGRLAEGLRTSQPRAAGLPKVDFQL